MIEVTQKRHGGTATKMPLADAIEYSIQETQGREGELERINAKIANQAEAFGKLFAYVVEGNFTEAAKAELISSVLDYTMTFERIEQPAG